MTKKAIKAAATKAAIVTKTPLEISLGGPEALIDQGMYDRAQLVIRAGIANDSEWEKCRALIDQLKGTRKDLETQRVEKTTPFNTVVSAFNKFFKSKIQDLDDTTQQLNDLYIDYNNKREAERKKQEAEEAERIRKETEAAEKAAADQAKASQEATADLFGDDEPAAAQDTPQEAPQAAPVRPIPVPVQPPLPKKPEPKKAPIKTTWYPVIEDAEKVPVKYKVPSEKLIMDDFDRGIREIPGVRFEAKQTVCKSR